MLKLYCLAVSPPLPARLAAGSTAVSVSFILHGWLKNYILCGCRKELCFVLAPKDRVGEKAGCRLETLP